MRKRPGNNNDIGRRTYERQDDTDFHVDLDSSYDPIDSDYADDGTYDDYDGADAVGGYGGGRPDDGTKVYKKPFYGDNRDNGGYLNDGDYLNDGYIDEDGYADDDYDDYGAHYSQGYDSGAYSGRGSYDDRDDYDGRGGYGDNSTYSGRSSYDDNRVYGERDSYDSSSERGYTEDGDYDGRGGYDGRDDYDRRGGYDDRDDYGEGGSYGSENGYDTDDGYEEPGGASGKKTNRQIMIVMYSVLTIFILMIGYIVYFDVVKSDEFINNPSNLRIAKLSDTVTRGKILASDGSVLAETLVDGEGNETRSYPYKNVFAHVVGTSEINKSGLESSNEFDMLSSSINPIKKAYNELKGVKSMGDSLVTTLDVNLQQTAYNALGNNNGVVVAIEPSTGKVLAMVSKPDYDPNTLKANYEAIIADTNSKVLLNQATFGKFAPGSIFKVVTALEYIREYPDYENYAYTCGGSIDLSSGAGHANLACYANTVHGYQGLQKSFANSCNASFANIGLSLDNKKWTQLSENLLFNKSLPTDFPSSKSSFNLSEDATDWEIGATAIGQGKTTVTPMHMAMLTSAVANGGVLMEPYIVDGVQNADGGGVSIHNPKSYGELMTTAEASKLTEFMQSVITEGTGRALNNMGYSIAGKTGTAETETAGNNAWFIGFAPAENPQIALCVLVENSRQSSSDVAVPIARQLFAAYVR